MTELERDVLEAITKSDYYTQPGSSVWSWSIVDHCRLATKKNIKGVVSSLSKKGLVKCQGAGEDSEVQITTKGLQSLGGGN